MAFENVSFGYADGHRGEPVLKNVFLRRRARERVAILGATGSGKSTLVNLNPTLLRRRGRGASPSTASTSRDVAQGALRHQTASPCKRPVLFNRLDPRQHPFTAGRGPPTPSRAAARAAQAHDFISEMPEGYDTVLGQRGVNLSGGQKQRIAIARALLRQPHILILDDSTSAVDVETEARIQQALDTIMRDRTSFVIAQRISTVLNADKILVLDQGELVAQGNHESLMNSSPVYQEIYESQLGDGARTYVDENRPRQTSPAAWVRARLRPGPGGPGGPHGFAGGGARAKNARGTVRRIWDYLAPSGSRLAVVFALVSVSPSSSWPGLTSWQGLG